jgi:hypothetical protein
MSFKRLDAEDFVVSADAVQSTAWSTNSPTLTSFFTSSVQMAGTSGDYYVSVFQTASTAGGAAIQFDVAYGNVKGSGSAYFNSAFPQFTPASTTYGQYRTMILEDENTNFSYGDGQNIFSPNDFWVISIDRARYKESIFPGSFNLALSGSGGLLQLTDNSNDTSVQTFLGSSRVYQLVSGSNGSSVAGGGYVAGSGSYGLLFPELGTILLNPGAISASIGVVPNRTADLADNTTNPITLINSLVLGSAFTINSQETITSDYVFVRARNSEFNYSSNPSNYQDHYLKILQRKV